MTKLHPHMRGIIYALSSYTLWVFMDALVRGASEYHLPTYEIMAVISPIMVATIFFVSFSKTRQIHPTLFSLWPCNIRLQLGLAILNFGAQYFSMLALAHLPLNNFYVAVFTAPMLISILAYFFLQETLGWGKILAIAAGFGGVVFAVWPSGDAHGDMVGYGAALISSTSYAACVTLSRKLTQTESAASLTFFNAMLQTLAGLAMMLTLGHNVALTPMLVGILVLAGLLNAIGNLCAYLAVTYAPAATASAYHYSQMITGAFVAYLVWHEVPSLRLVTGAVIIIAAGLYIARCTKQSTDS